MTTTSGISKSWHYGYTIVICCFLIMLVAVGLVMSCAGIFYKPVSQELGIEIGTFSIYMSLCFLFSTLTLTFAGRLMERYSARWILTICSAVTGLTMAAMSVFTSVWEFYAAGIIFGVTLAFLMYLGFATMLNRWFKTRMGLFLGICSAGSGIGGMLFNPLAGYLITEYGWRNAYLVFGAMILILVTPVVGVFMRDYPKDKGLLPYGASREDNIASSATIRSQNDGVDYSKAIRQPIFYGMILFAFLINATATLNGFLPAFAQSVSFSIEEAAFIASGAMVGVTVGKVILGMINDRSPLWGVLVTTSFGGFGLLLLLLGHVSIYPSVFGGFLFGWAYAGVTVQTPILVRTVFGNKHYARIYGNVSMAIAIGGAVAASGWGLLADAVGFYDILITGIAFLIISCVIGVVALKSEHKYV